MAADAESATVARVATEPEEVAWSWYHDKTTSWQEFTKIEIERIERLYQQGFWAIRVRSGKGRKSRPREVFFWDMVQHNRDSHKVRKVKREPPLSCEGRINRAFKVMKCAAENGTPLIVTLDGVTKQRKGEEGNMGDVLMTDNWCGRLASTARFNGLTNLLIVFSAIWIGIETDFNKAETVIHMDWEWIVVDWILCAFFTFELIIRYFAFQKGGERYFWRDRWCLFDLFLVMTNIITSVLINGTMLMLIRFTHIASYGDVGKFTGFFADLRLLRVVRLARLFRVAPKLLVLIKGIVEAFRSLVWMLILLGMLTGVFAIIFKSYAETSAAIGPDGTFDYTIKTTADAFWILWNYGVFMDAVGDLLLVLKDENQWWAVFFVVFICCANLTMLNMLIGILTEVITRVQGEEDLNSNMNRLQSGLLDLLECYDLSEDHKLSRKEFKMLMENPDMHLLLEEQDIDLEDLRAVEVVLFEDCELETGGPAKEAKIEWEHFLDVIFRLKGGNAAQVTDVVELRNFFRKAIKRASQGQLGSTPSEIGIGMGLGSVSETKAPSSSVSLRQTATAGGPRHFEEQVLAELRALRTDMEDMKADISIIQRHSDEADEFFGQLPGSIGEGC